ncbi:hypothetical protein LSPH24S_01461 [Lysinibacillus sphaericus]
MKTGRSTAGSRAAASHTGSLAGSDLIYDAFFRQSGIVRVDDYEEMTTFSKMILFNRLPQGKNTVLITSSGGRGINEADRCEGLGLNIIPLSEKTKTEIKKHIPSLKCQQSNRLNGSRFSNQSRAVYSAITSTHC